MGVMRAFFIYLSHRRELEGLFMKFKPTRNLAMRFVAGETLEDAINVVRELNRKNILGTLDHLGENVASREEAIEAANEYIRILDEIERNGIKSHASLKLTQMGMDISFDFCFDNVRRVIERAARYNNFVRIDMEDSSYTDRTLEIFYRLHEEFGNHVGIVIQAYLYRSEQDIKNLIAIGANVRLCKGAYKEPPEIAFPKKKDVDANYIKLMRMLLDAHDKGVYTAIATHDERIINFAENYVKSNGIPGNTFEFQMLYGIRRDLQFKIAEKNYKMRVYIPYGTEWYPYFMRRLAERPANVLFVLKNLFRG